MSTEAELRLAQIAEIAAPEAGALHRDELDWYRFMEAERLHLRPSQFPPSWIRYPGPLIKQCIDGHNSGQCPKCQALGVFNGGNFRMCDAFDCDWSEVLA